MPIKIAIKVGQFPAIPQTYVVYHAVALIERGYDVTILCGKKNGIEETSQPELIKKYSLLEKTVLLPVYSKTTLIKRFKTLAERVTTLHFVKLLQTLNTYKYGKKGLKGDYILHAKEIKLYNSFDLIHIHFGSYKSPLDVYKALGLIQPKIVLTLHGADVFFENELKKKRRQAEFKSAFRYFELITTNTPFLKRQIEEVGCNKKKLMDLKMPIDVDFFKPSESNQTKNEVFHILSIGSLIKWKTIKYGILAINELVKKGYPIQYTIVGKGPEKASLEKLIVDNHLEKVVYLVGTKTQAELLSLLHKSYLFLLPSTFDSLGRRETQGVVSGEAQAAGLPVIAFNSGGIPYTLENGVSGLLAAEQDYKAMACNIESLLLNPEKRNQMAKAARNHVVNKYSLNSIMDHWHGIYQNLLKN